ncbi:MAG: lycopene beta-cyclase CrtY [Polyangiales bacterium]
MNDFDIILVGGGLQGALLALAVFAERPRARIAMVEAGSALGGDHTWCFHAGDVSEVARAFVDPLVVTRWSRWEVRFPELQRTFDAEYACVTSGRLHEVLSSAFASRLGSRIFLGRRASTIEVDTVTLDDGRELRAELVIDARGPRAMAGEVAYQKFVGLEVELSKPAPSMCPVVMDAEVEQIDGYRFLYVLPFEERRVLLEDTYFSLDPALDDRTLEARILDYARSRDLHVARILRRERGILPLPLSWSQEPQREGPLVAGYGGGFFHPTTGYSFPVATRLAELVAKTPASDLFGAPLRSFVAAHARQARYAVMLNRLLFGATAEGNRRDVLERFHRFPEEVVRRFYALETTSGDRLRILCGRPPRGVSLRKALNEVVFT